MGGGADFLRRLIPTKDFAVYSASQVANLMVWEIKEGELVFLTRLKYQAGLTPMHLRKRCVIPLKT